MTIRCGVGLITCQRAPGEVRSDTEIYRDALVFARRADDLGFDSVWVSEHHFVDDGYLPSLLPLCAAIAATTTRITIGTALLLAPLFEPLRLAEDAGVVDLIAGGRFLLGLGLGWREEEFEGFGVPLSDRARGLEERVAICRAAWAGEPVRTDGSAVRVTPTPARVGGPPIWIGGLSERAARRAGRLGDGFMATEVDAAALAEQCTWARGERERSGLPAGTFEISVHLPTFVHDGKAEQGWAEALPLHRYAGWKYDDMDQARGRELGSPAPPSLRPDEEASLRGSIVFGDGPEVASAIRTLADAAGGDLHFIARLYWPGLAHARQISLLERFADWVLPLLR